MPTEPNLKPRILLMGVGAIGGVIAAGLLASGDDVTLVTHNNEISRALATEGLRVTRPDGRRDLPAAVCAGACPDLSSVGGRFDIALLAMKATAVEDATREIRPLLSPDGYVVTLQNGIVEDRVAEIVGRDHVIGALVGWGATMHRPGVYEMTSRGETTIGELDGGVTDRITRLKALLDHAVPTTVTAKIYGALWSKLAINCVITTLGAVTGQRLGQMLRRARVRRMALTIISEVIDVATALGVGLEPVGGTLDLQRLYLGPRRRRGGFGLDLVPRHAIMMLVGLRFYKLKSSMLQSLERGRVPEIEFMNGYVVEKGQAVGVPTPANTALAAMVREIAAGKRPISPENLDALGW